MKHKLPELTPTGTLHEQWLSYESGVLPANAGQEQRVQTQQAFYVGALIALRLTTELESLNGEAAILQLELLHSECESNLKSFGVGLS